MTEINHLNAINSLLNLLKLDDREIEEIYFLLGNAEIDTFMKELDNFWEIRPKDVDEFSLLEWLKMIYQKSPKTYEVLHEIVRENKQLFDKIQEIFIERLM